MSQTLNSESLYLEKLKDPRWQKKRLEIFERDEWRCQQCSNTKLTLVVHHRFYLPNCEPWDYPDDLLVTLCEKCHAEYSNLPEYERILLESIKRKFLLDDFLTLAVGFNEMSLLDNSSEVASAYSWALSDTDIQYDILQKHDELIQKVATDRQKGRI